MDHRDFDLHESEEHNLIYRILQLAGIAMKDANLVQSAYTKQVENDNKEK